MKDRSDEDRTTETIRAPLARRAVIRTCLMAMAAAAVWPATKAFAQAGTWTALPSDPITGSPHRNAVLLTDGRVLAQAEFDGHQWSVLTPDASGSYVNGTWTAAAPSSIDRRYFPYAVLKDGRVFIAGGEFLGGNETDQNAAEIYEPFLNTWTSQPDGLFGDIGDVAYQVLTDGRLLVGYRFGPQSQLFDPVAATWTQALAGTRTTGNGDEETWNLLPNGTVLDWTAPQPTKYLPSTNQWVNDTVPPITMQNPSDGEVGPGVFLYNGKLLVYSAFGNTALYTPSASPTTAGTWTTGPSVPAATQTNDNPSGTQFVEDAPACIEPNGRVITVSTNQRLAAWTSFSEYNPATNTIAAIPAPPLDPNLAGFSLHFVALPNGQILMTGTATTDFVWTPVGSPQSAWKPTVSSIAAAADGSFTLTGTQLSGLSQASSYGDEGNGQSNYPLVKLVSGGIVRYARTYNHSTMGFATGGTSVQTHFIVPQSTPAGTYQVSAIANGIASSPVNLTLATTQLAGSMVLYNQWSSGYCNNVTVKNTRGQATTSWKVLFNLGNATFNAMWNGTFSQSGSTLTVNNASNNGNVAPGATVTFGFCTQGPTPVSVPLMTSVTGS